MRIAFYGGSFDPPHLGHLRIAQAAADRLRLDRVLLVPVALQPLKQKGPPPAGYADRLAMLELLLDEAGDDRLECSGLDAPRPDGLPNYTCETMERLRAALGPEDALFVLAGADALLTLPQWHRVRELIFLADFIVAARPGFALDRLAEALAELIPAGRMVPGEESGNGVVHLVLEAERGAGEASGTSRKANFYLLADLDEDISSTAIRAALAKGLEGEALDLSPAVGGYIGRRGLYRSPGPGATIGR